MPFFFSYPNINANWVTNSFRYCNTFKVSNAVCVKCLHTNSNGDKCLDTCLDGDKLYLTNNITDDKSFRSCNLDTNNHSNDINVSNIVFNTHDIIDSKCFCFSHFEPDVVAVSWRITIIVSSYDSFLLPNYFLLCHFINNKFSK